MLVLSRRSRESVVVGSSGGLARLVTVTVLDIHDGRVKLGFDAPPDMPVHRLEVWQRIQAEDEQQGPMSLAMVPAPH